MKKKITEHAFPSELKEMNIKELELLSYEIRDFLLDNVSKTGGHIASNLGVVELTIALHKAFNSPVDKIIWDVGHQSYVHKILTGRAECFDSLRSSGGLSGFPKRCESSHDSFDTGHSSNSISAALGFAKARDLQGQDNFIVSVIGDGALTGGMAYEAMNNVGNTPKFIIILNDNEMSIEKNIGGVSKHLSKLRTSQAYRDFKKKLKNKLKGFPKLGDGLYKSIEHLRDSIKYAIMPGVLFEELGIKYFGPIDGHNLTDLMEALELAKVMEGPVVLHVITKKGKGYKNAEQNPEKFHGISPFNPATGSIVNQNNDFTYSNVFGNKLVQLAKTDNRIIAVSAAMISGTGLEKFSKQFPDRIFDVGIAEEHAVTFAAGMSLGGLRPFVAIYSTFLQRAYDQILIDVCMQNIPVTFCIDRAGIVGNDGETHNGVFDLSYLNHMPNMTVMVPKDGKELAHMLEYSLKIDGPCAIRYPRGNVSNLSHHSNHNEEEILYGTWEYSHLGKDINIIACGKMVEVAYDVKNLLAYRNYDVGIINARFTKPLDAYALEKIKTTSNKIVTLEDNVVTGGLGSVINDYYSKDNINILNIGWPDRFIEHGNTVEIFKSYGLDDESIYKKVSDFIERKA